MATPAGSDWDVEIDEVGHFVIPNNEYRYMRGAIDVQRNQIDASSEPGEQSLTGWWYRSQSSFHLGMGQEYFDTVKGSETDQYRFDDSYGMFPFEKGEVTLQPEAVKATHNGGPLQYDLATLGKPQQYVIPKAAGGGVYNTESGIVYPYGNNIMKLPWATPNSADALDAKELFTKDDTLSAGMLAVLDVAVMGQYVWYWCLVKEKDTDSKPVIAQIRRTKLTDQGDTKIFWAVYVGDKQLNFEVDKNPDDPEEGTESKPFQVGMGYSTATDNYRTARLSFRNSVLSATFGKYWWSLPNPESLKDKDGADQFEWLNVTIDANLPKTLNRLLFKHPDHNYCFLDVARTNGPILACGTQVQTDQIIYGNRSQVWAALVKEDQTAGSDIVEMDVPFVTAETPAGEIIYRMDVSMNFTFLGTDIGLRVAEVNTQGDMLIGPPHRTDGPVFDTCNYGQYVWFTGSGTGGVYRLDLRNAVNPQSFLFAYCRDGELAQLDSVEHQGVVADGGFPRNEPAVHVEMFGKSESPIWFYAPAPKGDGYYYSSLKYNPNAAGDRGVVRPTAPHGWIRTPRLRMDTWEFKLFQYLRTVWDPRRDTGSIQPNWIETPGAQPKNLLAGDLWRVVDGDGYVDTPASHPDGQGGGDPQPLVDSGYLFKLRRDTHVPGRNGEERSPAFKGYQVKANPTEVADKKITLPLMCARREKMRQGRTVMRSTWERISAMEKLQRSGQIVDYKDLGTGETGRVRVEGCRFVTTFVPQSKAEHEDRVGVLLVELRMVESETEYNMDDSAFTV